MIHRDRHPARVSAIFAGIQTPFACIRRRTALRRAADERDRDGNAHTEDFRPTCHLTPTPHPFCARNLLLRPQNKRSNPVLVAL
jgi:hypothetical protein